jgi:hypothetical protein
VKTLSTTVPDSMTLGTAESAGKLPRTVFVDVEPRTGLGTEGKGRLGSSTDGSAGSASGGGVAKIGGEGRPCGSRNSVMTHHGTSDSTDETDDAIS